MKAIVIATKGAEALSVLSASIDAYVPEDVVVYIGSLATKPNMFPKKHQWVVVPNVADNYGDAYNSVVERAFLNHDDIIVANDDIVLTPTSYILLSEDVNSLKKEFAKVGWVVARSDYVRPQQQAFRMDPHRIAHTQRCAPLFGYVNVKAWVDYAPINWYSDDIQCIDMISKGCQHFVSRSYVHHAGSQTIGLDNQKNHLDSEQWIKDNRPELHQEWYK
jgi:hypothetical protein